MTEEQTAALQAEKADLSRKMAARKRVGLGYTANTEAIKARIDEIDKELTPNNG